MTAARIPASLVRTDTGAPSSQAGATGPGPRSFCARATDGVTDASPCDVTTSARPDKSQLRRDARQRRTNVDLRTGAALCEAVLGLPEVASASCVTAYVARMAEPDTAPLIAELHRRGVRVLLPVLLPDLDLDWAVDDGERHRSSVHRGLTEPTGTPLGPAAIAAADVILHWPWRSTAAECGWGTAVAATTGR